MDFSFDKVIRWAHELDNWFGIGLFTLMVAFGFFALGLYINDSHRRESTMAKKAEQKKIAGIVEVALSAAMNQGLISAAQYKKHCARLGKAMGLPDLVPEYKKKIVILPGGKMISYPKVFLDKTKALVMRRLEAMGVNIADGLKKIRSKQEVDKRKELEKTMKSSKKTKQHLKGAHIDAAFPNDRHP